MKQYTHKGISVIAASREEAAKQLASKVTASTVKSIDYDDPSIMYYYRSNAIRGIDFDRLLRVLVDAGIYYAEDLTKEHRYRAAYSLNSNKELQKAVLNNDLEGVKKFVKEWDEANGWDGTCWPAMSKKKSSVAKDILSRYHKNKPFVEKVDKAKLMEKAMLQAVHDAGVDDIGKLSDGYHTYDDLYYQRLIMFVVLSKIFEHLAWKTKRHDDGELCFGGTNFLVCIDTPEGPYSYHYPLKHWDLFKCKELPKAKPFDGHTSKDVDRLLSLTKLLPKNLASLFIKK